MPSSAVQQSEAILQPIGEVENAHRARARRGELNGEWNTIQSFTDRSDRFDFGFGETERQICRTGPLAEQLDPERAWIER